MYLYLSLLLLPPCLSFSYVPSFPPSLLSSLPSAKDSFAGLEDMMRVSVNTLRVKDGQKPLESDLGLSQAALSLAEEMAKKDAKNGKLTAEDEATLLDRAKKAGFKVRRGRREGGREKGKEGMWSEERNDSLIRIAHPSPLPPPPYSFPFSGHDCQGELLQLRCQEGGPGRQER